MDIFDPSTIPLIGLTSLVLLGARAWLSVLRRLPADGRPISQPKFHNLEIPHTLTTNSLGGDESFQAVGLAGWKRSNPGNSSERNLFEFKQRSERLITFYFGEVSGKGLPGSLYRVSCTTLLEQASGISVDPVGVVSEVNQTLANRESDGRYATLLYGTLEVTSGRLRLLSAGHSNPLRLAGNGVVDFLECSPCLPIGVVPDHRFVLTEHRLEPGDTLLFYTSGLTKTRNWEREVFGEFSLKELLIQNSHLSPKNLTETVLREVSRFSDNRNEDQTVVALHYSGIPSGFETNKLQAPPVALLKYAFG